MKGSYQLDSFTKNKSSEVNRLKSQVDLFFKKEFELYKKLGLKDGMKIIECGSGPGFLLMSILDQMPNCEATGLEIDPYLFEILKNNSVKNNRKLFDAKHESIYETKLPSNSFDFVISRLVLEHLQYPVKALEELKRIVKPQGTVVIISNDFAYHLITYPFIPELDEMYDAYCRSRFSEGGNPLIGRQLPNLLSKAGYSQIGIDIVCVHNALEGDKAFLKAENVNISKSLVEKGFLKKESLDKLAENWYKMLQQPDHVMYRQLFIVNGKKGEEETITTQKDQILINKYDKTATKELEGLDIPEQKSWLREYMINKIKSIFENPSLSVDPKLRLAEIDIDSLSATELSGLLKSDFNVEIRISDILEKYSVNDISDIVIKSISENKSNIEINKNKENNWIEGEI